MAISRSIVKLVRNMSDPPGRFLEKDVTTGLWNDVGDKKAIEKTSQALRDGAATLRKELAENCTTSSPGGGTGAVEAIVGGGGNGSCC